MEPAPRMEGGRELGARWASLWPPRGRRESLDAMGEASARGSLLPFDSEQFRSHAHRVVDFIADYYRDIESFPVRSNVKPGYLGPLLPASAPENGEPLDDILQDIREKIMPGVTHWQSPSFFAYFPANSSTAGLLGEMLSGAFNVIGFSWVGSPAATELETHVLDWMAGLMDLPACFNTSASGGIGGGVIQGSASEAVLVAMLAARTKKVSELQTLGLSQSEAAAKLVAYTSEQAHACVQKACMIAGIEPQNFRPLPTDASTNWALQPSVLLNAMEEDKAAGKVPFFICATVGTTSSTAIDPVALLGPIAQESDAWLHVDAAYAGSALLCPEFRHHFEGLELANSFCFNPHKWMLTNFDCSCLWVKESKFLRNALSLSPEYLRNKASEANNVVDFKDWQIPLGRRFRSIKLWLVLRLYGATGLQTYIRKHVDMARHLEALIAADDRFQMVAPRTFSLVCFRLKAPSGEEEDGRALNAALLEAVNAGGQLFFTHTVMGGVFTLRMAIGGTQTELRHVEAAWNVIQTQAAALLRA